MLLFFQNPTDIGSPQLWAETGGLFGLVLMVLCLLMILLFGVLVWVVKKTVSHMGEMDNKINEGNVLVQKMSQNIFEKQVLFNSNLAGLIEDVKTLKLSNEDTQRGNAELIRNSEEYMCKLMKEVQSELKLLSDRSDSNVQIMSMMNDNIKSLRNE